MANGWGGRRTGSGAPQGNNNAVKHGRYCRPCIHVNSHNLLELRSLNIAVCRELYSLPGVLRGTSDEQREWVRLAGILDWIASKLIQVELKKSRDLTEQAKAKLSEAKARLIAANTLLIEAKTRKMIAEIRASL